MAEPLKATFFTLQKRDKAVLFPATIVAGALGALVIAAFVAVNWGAISRFASLFEMAAQPSDSMSEDAAAQFVFGMFGLFGSALLFLFPLYLVIAAYEAACLRWMIRGEAPGLFGVTLDYDTWRVYGVYWCWFLLHMVVGVIMSIIMVPIMFMMMGDLIAQGPSTDMQSMWAFQLKLQSLSLLQYIPLVFLGIRLGPAAATSIARREFSFLEAWSVTRGRFWTLLGSFALLWFLFGLANVILFGATYGPLVGDIVAEWVKAWPNIPAERASELHARLFAPAGLAMMGAAYAGSLILWIGYGLMSSGVNAFCARSQSNARWQSGKLRGVSQRRATSGARSVVRSSSMRAVKLWHSRASSARSSRYCWRNCSQWPRCARLASHTRRTLRPTGSLS